MEKEVFKSKEDAKYWPCLLRRLTDFAPDEKKENYSQGITIRQLKKDIFDNIEMILNSRSHPQAEDLEKYPEIDDSVLAYGLTDFCGKVCSMDDKETIREHILHQLRVFEPRLNPDTIDVSLSQNDRETKSVLEFQISGMIDVAELSEEIVFISRLDLETGNSYLKNSQE